MSRARPLMAAVALAFVMLAPSAAYGATATPKPTRPVAPSASPLPSISPYDPGPKPVNVINLCALNLKVNPPLFQNAKAPLAIAPNEVDSVKSSLESAGTPMFVSILSGSGERARGSSREIQDQMGVRGTFLTIIGTVYDTFSTEFDSQELLAHAFAEQRSNGTAAVIERFAELSGQASRGEISTPDMIAWRPTLILVGAVLVIGFGYLLLRRRSEKEEETHEPSPPTGSVDLPESS